MKKEEMAQNLNRSFTRLSRFINQLMREQLTCGPVTVQQCYTLEVLAEGPKTMKTLACEVGLHQSTLSRIVEKLEKQDLVVRAREADNLRTVNVRITESGEKIYQLLYGESMRMISSLLELIPKNRQKNIVEAMDLLSGLLDPQNNAFRELLKSCSACKIDTGEIE